MNNLHRELAPISEKAWAQIEEEATRTLKRHLAARRVVDVCGPKGTELAAVGTGHQRDIEPPAAGIQAAQREAKALVELRVPFQLTREAIDDVERGATDSNWTPVKEAARKIALAEDSSVFEGYAAAGIEGITMASGSKICPAGFARGSRSGAGPPGQDDFGRSQYQRGVPRDQEHGRRPAGRLAVASSGFGDRRDDPQPLQCRRHRTR